MRAGFVACVAALAVSVFISTAAADDGDKNKAREHFISATKAMDAGDYAFAAQQFAIAYEYTKDPVLFYRIGKANDLAGDCQTALVYYKRYMNEANPDEEFTKLTNDLIGACNKKLGIDDGTGATGTGDDDDDGSGTGIMLPGDDDDAPPPDDPVKPPSFTDEKPTWKRTAAWVSVGLTVAAVTTGAVLGLSASSREEDIENLISFRDAQGNPASFDGNTKERYEELIDEGDRLNSLSVVAFGVAGGAAAAAIVFFILDSTSSSGEQQVASGNYITPVVTADGGLGVNAGWSF
jgi:hypothetical protein